MTVVMPAPVPTPVPAPAVEARRGHADVIYVLCLVQVASLLLAAVGETLLMGGQPLYLALPVIKSVLLLLFAAKAVQGRRWALIALIVLSAMTLAGFLIQALAALAIAAVGFTPNLVVLLTNVGLPVAILVLAIKAMKAVAP